MRKILPFFLLAAMLLGLCPAAYAVTGPVIPLASTYDLAAAATTDCQICFDKYNGSEAEVCSVPLGTKLIAPPEPLREGFRFTGWYRDHDLTIPWDFDKDTVQGNMTLYAAWEDITPSSTAPAKNDSSLRVAAALLLLCILFLLLLLLGLLLSKKTVMFDSCGGTPIDSIKILWNGRIRTYPYPVKPNATFAGWYTRPVGGISWDFARHRVRKNITLYAQWY